jgi:hypothetical protein
MHKGEVILEEFKGFFRKKVEGSEAIEKASNFNIHVVRFCIRKTLPEVKFDARRYYHKTA